MKKGKLVIISGPSGVGKSTIRQQVLETISDAWYSVSMTTRPKRENEQEGIDYYFISKEQFLENIKNDNFIEYEEVYNGDLYGTPKDAVFNKINAGISVFLEIDVIGALMVKEKYPDTLMIFIMPPSMEELERRLVHRYTDTQEKIKERLEKAKKEITYKDRYDKVIINDTVEKTVQEFVDVVEENRKKHII